MTMSVEDKIDAMLTQACEENNWNPTYVEEYTMAAAVKASAYFQALGYDYGDRIPSVYKLNDTLKELVAFVGTDIDRTREVSYNSTGMFRVTKQWDTFAEQWELNISLELQDIYENRIFNDN